MTEFATWYLIIFGVLTVVGGVIGFVKAQSKASLIAGGVAGVLLILSGVHAMVRDVKTGMILGLVFSVLLAGRFVPAFLKTKKPMPAGMMSMLSVLGIVLTILVLVTA